MIKKIYLIIFLLLVSTNTYAQEINRFDFTGYFQNIANQTYLENFFKFFDVANIDTELKIPKKVRAASENIKQSADLADIKNNSAMTKGIQTYFGIEPDGKWGKQTENMFSKLQLIIDKNSDETLQQIDNDLDKGFTYKNSPTVMNSSNYNGNYGGPLNKNLKEAGDGWLSGPTTHFGTEWNNKRDSTPGSNCTAAMDQKINICSPETCIVSLPMAAQVYYWGNEIQKEKMKSLIGSNSSRQVKSLKWSYSKIKGTPIEIVNLSNGKCTVAPLWETGPGDTENGAIDLTPCIKKVIGNKSNFQSKFRPVKNGQKACEGYEYVESIVIKK